MIGPLLNEDRFEKTSDKKLNWSSLGAYTDARVRGSPSVVTFKNRHLPDGSISCESIKVQNLEERRMATSLDLEVPNTSTCAGYRAVLKRGSEDFVLCVSCKNTISACDFNSVDNILFNLILLLSHCNSKTVTAMGSICHGSFKYRKINLVYVLLVSRTKILKQHL